LDEIWRTSHQHSEFDIFGSSRFFSPWNWGGQFYKILGLCPKLKILHVFHRDFSELDCDDKLTELENFKYTLFPQLIAAYIQIRFHSMGVEEIFRVRTKATINDYDNKFIKAYKMLPGVLANRIPNLGKVVKITPWESPVPDYR